MRIIVAGSSTWVNRASIRSELESLPTETVIIHGDSPGADEIGGEIARELGMVVEPMSKNSEDYRRYNRGAWKALNERMINADIDSILAFHADVDRSNGTKHLLKLAKERGVPYRVIEV